MKKILSLAAVFCLLAGAWSRPVPVAGASLPAETTLYAAGAILVSLGATPDKDVVMFEQNADTRLKPGGMLRMMVGAYAIRQIRERSLDTDGVTGTYTSSLDRLISGTGLSVANMKIGDTWSVRDLLTATLMSTAADATVVLAAAISETPDAFLEGMNALAGELGCVNTHFSNVTGLDDGLLYTTARDMAAITRYAMDFPELTAMMSLSQYTVEPVKGKKQTFVNANNMGRKGSGSDYYAPLRFGRTGNSSDDGRCMASVAKDGGYEYLVVVMGCKTPAGVSASSAHYTDSKTLYKWAFSTFAYKNLLSRNTPVTQINVDLAWASDRVSLLAQNDISAMVDKNLDPSAVRLVPVVDGKVVDAPIEKGKVYGKVEVYIHLDQKVGETALIAAEGLERSEVLALWRKTKEIFSSPWPYLGLGGFILLIGLYAILNIVHNRKKGRIMRKR